MEMEIWHCRALYPLRLVGGCGIHTYIHTYLLLAGRLQMAATPFDTLPNNHGITSKFQFQVHRLGGNALWLLLWGFVE